MDTLTFSHTARVIPKHIYIYGAGGTGSRVVPLIAQFVKSLPWVIDPKIFVFDGDVVEPKNLSRQLFTSRDLGKNKAQVIAERYSAAFGIEIHGIPYFFDNAVVSKVRKELSVSVANLLAGTGETLEPPGIHILCVDSAAARRTILNAFEGNYPYLLNYPISYGDSYVIDSGNGNDFGQVSVSNLRVPKLGTADHRCATLLADSWPKLERIASARGPLHFDLPFIPFDLEYFSHMTDETEEEKVAASCADLDQTMAINNLMAANILSTVQNIYYVRPIRYQKLHVTLGDGVYPTYLNLRSILSRGYYDILNGVYDDPLPGPILDSSFRNNLIDHSGGFESVFKNTIGCYPLDIPSMSNAHLLEYYDEHLKCKK